MPSPEVRLLRPSDDRSAFRSGDPDLDRFFHKYAGQNQFRHHLGVTWVAVDPDAGDRLLGFVTVSASHLETTDLPSSQRRRLPRYPLPVLRLARLAVDETARGRGIGLALLKAVFVLARQMAGVVGCTGVVVDAKPGVIGFYERFGFEVLQDLHEGELGDRPRPRPMFLPLTLIPSGS
jgi:GNAT superfamily N-acetyltransferase